MVFILLVSLWDIRTLDGHGGRVAQFTVNQISSDEGERPLGIQGGKLVPALEICICKNAYESIPSKLR